MLYLNSLASRTHRWWRNLSPFWMSTLLAGCIYNYYVNTRKHKATIRNGRAVCLGRSCWNSFCIMFNKRSSSNCCFDAISPSFDWLNRSHPFKEHIFMLAGHQFIFRFSFVTGTCLVFDFSIMLLSLLLSLEEMMANAQQHHKNT